MKLVKKEFTKNEAVEMMHNHTSVTLKDIVDLIQKSEMSSDEIIEYLLEISEGFAAQALVVALRDELNFCRPQL